MGQGIGGNYDGEGPNVAAHVNGTLHNPGPIAPSPDVFDKRGSLNNGIAGGQGIGGTVAIDRRGRLRTSDEPARSGVVLNVGGGDQVLSVCARYFYCSTSGNLVCRLADDSADLTFTGMVAGATYPISIAVVKASGTTAGGILLF